MDQKTEEPSGLIDLHAHIVPGVDDGSESEKESFDMLRLAEKAGTECIVATPHVFSKLNTEKDLESILQKQEEFLEKVRLLNFRLNLLSGAEVFFATNLRELLNRYGRFLALNRTCYFILEFPFDFIFPGIKNFIFNLLMDGWIPIIAHPERNQVIQRTPRILYEMVDQGAFSQVNAGSLEGKFGPEVRETAIRLIRFGLVHVVASDAHSLNSRPPVLDLAYRHVWEIDPGKADHLFKDNPRAILGDKGLPGMDEPRDPQKRVKFFDFIRRRKS